MSEPKTCGGSGMVDPRHSDKMCPGCVDCLRVEVERIRKALGGYPDSDLVSLAISLRTRVDMANVLRDDVVDRLRDLLGRAYDDMRATTEDDEPCGCNGTPPRCLFCDLRRALFPAADALRGVPGDE